MKKRSYFKIWIEVVISLLLTLGAVIAAQGSELDSEDRAIHIPAAAYQVVTLEELSASPDHFDGLKIYVAGWARGVEMPQNDNTRILTLGLLDYPEIKIIVPSTVPLFGVIFGRPFEIWGTFKVEDEEIDTSRHFGHHVVVDWISLDWEKMN